LFPLTEPATLVTDYALAALCVGFACSLWKRSRAFGGRRVGPWVAAFLVTAFAALAGGTSHGFRIPLGESRRSVWNVTVASIAAGALLLIAAGVRSATRGEPKDEASRREGILWLERAIVVSLLGLAVLVGKLSIHPHFNQNDLYHVIQMVGLYGLYRGALLLHGLSGSDS
ncbi:MAG: DUF6962 family protein, partial [Vicinamibacteria bacterium]